MSTIKVVQGEDFTLTQVVLDKVTGLPLKISSFNGATGFFPGTAGSPLSVSGSLLSGDLGQVQFQLSQSFTAQLLAGTELDYEVAVLNGTDLTIQQILANLEVDARLFT